MLDGKASQLEGSGLTCERLLKPSTQDTGDLPKKATPYRRSNRAHEGRDGPLGRPSATVPSITLVTRVMYCR